MQDPYAFIYDPTDGVGSVHFGISIIFGLREQIVFPKSDEIVDGRWIPVDELVADTTLEGWSRAVVEAWKA